jgi:20S proteasome alpha/beta subunit
MSSVLTMLILSMYAVMSSASVVVCVTCTDGILLGSDSFSSISPSKQSLIQNTAFRNVFPLDEFTVAVHVAGSTAFYRLLDEIHVEILRYKSLQVDYSTSSCKRLSATVISNIARRLINEKYRSVHLFIAGHDIESSTSSLYEIAPNGMIVKQINASGGSGSDTITSLIDIEFEQTKTVDISAPILRQALLRSLGQDSRTKGKVQLWSLTKNGLMHL